MDGGDFFLQNFLFKLPRDKQVLLSSAYLASASPCEFRENVLKLELLFFPQYRMQGVSMEML